jgi:Domain of unknown function (DUF4360)
MNKILLLIAAISTSYAFADDIRLGEPAYGGSGCPRGSASAALSPDQKTLSILFDKFQADAGGNTRLRVDRKTCDIAIPVHVPQGYSISLFKLDYRGFNSLPAGASSRLNVNYFFAGQSGPVVNRTWVGAQNADYYVTDNVAASSLVWSPCGQSTNLRVNSSIMAITNSANQQTFATVDSTDIKAGLVYHVQWRKCN